MFFWNILGQVEAYDTDELNFHGGLRVSFGMQLMGAVARIEREIPSIRWPFLLLHGDADKLCDIRGSKVMYETASSSDKKIKVGNVFIHVDIWLISAWWSSLSLCMHLIFLLNVLLGLWGRLPRSSPRPPRGSWVRAERRDLLDHRTPPPNDIVTTARLVDLHNLINTMRKQSFVHFSCSLAGIIILLYGIYMWAYSWAFCV